MDIKKSKLYIFILVVIVAGGVFIWKVNDNSGSDQKQTASQAAVQPAAKTSVSYDGVAGKNALALLKDSHRVETKTYKGLGELVTSIDGVSADSKNFWAFYVNDKQSQIGAGVYTTKNGDKITWKLEAIQ